MVTKTSNGTLETNQVRGFADLLTLIDKAERDGFRQERKRWVKTADASVFTFAGPSDANGRNAIWAAVQIQSDNRTVMLLKLVDDYSGAVESHEGFLADALDRSARGTRHD
jgi:hypothetical protein